MPPEDSTSRATPEATVQALAAMLDSLGIGVAVYDDADRAVLWNGSFLQLFPEHAGCIARGEPYAENLRRFYASRLAPAEAVHMDRFVADGIARHRRQSWPFEFNHRGRRLRVASLPLPGLGRMRLWVPQAPGNEAGATTLPTPAREAMPDGLMVRDPGGRILFLNRRGCALLGLVTPEDAIGRRFADLLVHAWVGHAGAEEALRQLGDAVEFAGAPFELALPDEVRLRVTEHRDDDGSIITTLVDISDLHRAQRRVTAEKLEAEALAAALRLEVAERERAERQMQANEKRMRRMLDSMPVPLLCSSLGPEPRVIYVNRSFVNRFGYALEDLASVEEWAMRSLAEAGAEAAPEWLLALRRAAAGVRPVAPVETRLRHRDGSLRDVQVSMEALDDLVLVALVDITERRRAEARAISVARLATLGEVATGLAHELTQPLAAISLAAENCQALLRRDPAAALEEVLRRQQRIVAMAMRAKEITDHLKLFGRRQDQELEAVPLADALGGALLLVGGPLREAEVVVESGLHPGLPPVRARRVLLEQVLLNLLLNARDAMAALPPEARRVTVTASAGEGPVCLVLRDHGTGIPPEVMPRLFEPFFTTKAVGQGTGLGLSICHGIVQSFGGSIAVENDAGGGAAFTLRLRPAAG